MKRILLLLIAVGAMVFPSYGTFTGFTSSDSSKFMGSFDKVVYIEPGGDFYIHFSPQTGVEFKEENLNISIKERMALSKAPEWIRWRLGRQFERIGDEYADLILNSSDRYVDEIAFSIATSPYNAMPSPELLADNAYFIYRNDEYLDYVDVVDFENGSSTIRYRTLDDDGVKEITCPMGIYYWYVVHPRITFEDAEYVYNKFWREYLFYHNDIGYPLLMEKLHGIEYLWDNQSYRPPAHRTWKWSMENHPTAVEAINYWIGKTITEYATGDRPGQPNVIAHEHNGFCGEIQQLSVAAQRAALIPTVGINDLGEDHVWREFWERGWHQCDNWWADEGGSVANYGEYRYGWGKIISALFAWNGDSSIYDVTPKYIHESDMGSIRVEVRDILGRPVDGARVMVFGSWKANNFKDRLWGKYIDALWSKLPEELRKKYQERYDEMKKFYHERVPGLIPWILPSTWNYTDMNGTCSFRLGLGHSYLIMVQKDDIFYYGPFSVGKSNGMKYFVSLKENSTRNARVIFVIPDRKHTMNMEVGNLAGRDYRFSLDFNCRGYQEQRNPWDWKYGMEDVDAKVNFFVVDEENFEKYRRGEKFECSRYVYSSDGHDEFEGNDVYIVFNNTATRTGVLLHISLSIYGDGNMIYLDLPSTGLLNAGMNYINGYSTGNGKVRIGEQVFNVSGNFSIQWNAAMGKHEVVAICGDFARTYEVEVVDFTPPEIVVKSPREGMVFDGDVRIEGEAMDNGDIDSLLIYIDGEPISSENPFNFTLSLPPGDHVMKIKAMDGSGLESIESINFTVAGEDAIPVIENISFTPSTPSEDDNVVVYAIVTPSFYKIRNVSIIVDGVEKKMFMYASNPVQPRHEEDALANISNEPRYGVELGQMEKGEHVFYVVAMDTAGNMAKSDGYMISIS